FLTDFKKKKFYRVELLKFLRKERKFRNITELKKQIQRDINKSFQTLKKFVKK
ncbi:MAG: hypothetical protein DRI36_05110, partial [Caldiserica bacterium]